MQAASAASSAASTASYAAASVVAASAGVLLTRRPGAMSKTTVTALQAPGIHLLSLIMTHSTIAQIKETDETGLNMFEWF